MPNVQQPLAVPQRWLPRRLMLEPIVLLAHEAGGPRGRRIFAHESGCSVMRIVDSEMRSDERDDIPEERILLVVRRMAS